jgi:hypothetical protein
MGSPGVSGRDPGDERDEFAPGPLAQSLRPRQLQYRSGPVQYGLRPCQDPDIAAFAEWRCMWNAQLSLGYRQLRDLRACTDIGREPQTRAGSTAAAPTGSFVRAKTGRCCVPGRWGGHPVPSALPPDPFPPQVTRMRSTSGRAAQRPARKPVVALNAPPGVLRVALKLRP